MCGLFGITSVKNSQLHKVRSAINSMSHRGPDGIGEYQHDHVYSTHARLSIIDLSANGTQPMTDREYGVTISVNGEIYNHLELRRELSDRHQFLSKSDYMVSKVVTAVDFRAKNIETIENLEKNSIDFYASVRSLYLQDRQKKINNKNPTIEIMYEADWEEIESN